MTKRCLSREVIIEAAIALAKQTGYEGYSLRELAHVLHVQPSSLYNHISGLEEIRVEVGLAGIHRLHEMLCEAGAQKPLDRAVADMAYTYCTFAQQHPGLYQTLIAIKMDGNERLRAELPCIIMPFIDVISQSGLPEDIVTHLHRMLRCLLHGFLTLSHSGYLSHGAISADESFSFFLESFSKIIKQYQQEKGVSSIE